MALARGQLGSADQATRIGGSGSAFGDRCKLSWREGNLGAGEVTAGAEEASYFGEEANFVGEEGTFVGEAGTFAEREGMSWRRGG